MINIISLLGELKGKADENLQIAGTGVGIFVFSACSYLALANFSEAVQVLKSDVKDKYSQAAKKVAIALGAASGGFVSLSGALANLSKTAIIPAGTVLGTSATMACVGLGPIINDIRGVYLHMGKGEFK